MQADSRMAKWDNIKFILITLVVVGHFADYYADGSSNMKSLYFFIYIFHMPLFIFIAGLFSKKTIHANTLDMTRIYPYFIMYLLTKLLIFITKVGFGENPSFSLLKEKGVPWFMFAMFIWYITTYFLKNLNVKYVLICSIAIACFAGYDKSVGDFLVLSRILVFYPFFLLGYYLPVDKIMDTFDNIKIKVASFVLIVITMLVCLTKIDKIYWLRPILTARQPFCSLGEMSQYGPLIRLLYYVFTIIFMVSIIAIVPNRKLLISDLGKRTLQVYVLHKVILYAYQKVDINAKLSKIVPNQWKYIYLLFAIILTFILSSKLLEKPFQWIMRPQKREIKK